MVETDNPVDNACIDSELDTVKQRSTHNRQNGTAKISSENKTREKVIT